MGFEANVGESTEQSFDRMHVSCKLVKSLIEGEGEREGKRERERRREVDTWSSRMEGSR